MVTYTLVDLGRGWGELRTEYGRIRGDNQSLAELCDIISQFETNDTVVMPAALSRRPRWWERLLCS